MEEIVKHSGKNNHKNMFSPFKKCVSFTTEYYLNKQLKRKPIQM